MQKAWKVILSISIICNIILGTLLYRESKEIVSNPNEYIQKIDSLELVLSALNTKRDSVKDRIDTVNIYLEQVEKDYEEVRIDIMDNSTSDDYKFFTEYLKRNKERLDSINNSKSIKRN